MRQRGSQLRSLRFIALAVLPLAGRAAGAAPIKTSKPLLSRQIEPIQMTVQPINGNTAIDPKVNDRVRTAVIQSTGGM